MAKEKDTHTAVPYNPEDWERGKARTAKPKTATPPPRATTPPPATESKKASKSALTVHPDKAYAAIDLLEKFVAERAELIRDRMNLGDTVNAIRMMDALYKLKEQLADRVKSPVEKAYDTMRFTVVPEFMDEADITTIGVDGVGRCNVQDDITVKVEDKVALKNWLIENEKEDLITESVNAQTLAAFIRQRMKAKETIPDETIITVTPVTRAQITRSKS